MKSQEIEENTLHELRQTQKEKHIYSLINIEQRKTSTQSTVPEKLGD